MNIDVLADIIGIVGTLLVVGSYFLMQLDKLNPKSIRFNLINLFGAIFLLISLLVHFNLASFIIELFWIAASLIGIYKHIIQKRGSTPSSM